MMADIIIGVNFIHQMRCSQARSRIATRRAGGPPRLTYSEHRMCRIINSLIHLSSCRSVAARSRRNSSTLTNPARPRRAKANSCTLWCLGWSTHVEWWGWGDTCLLPLVCLSTTGMVECGGSFPTRALHRRRYGSECEGILLCVARSICPHRLATRRRHHVGSMN